MGAESRLGGFGLKNLAGEFRVWVCRTGQIWPVRNLAAGVAGCETAPLNLLG